MNYFEALANQEINTNGKFNPYAADVTFVQCTKKQKIMKII